MLYLQWVQWKSLGHFRSLLALSWCRSLKKEEKLNKKKAAAWKERKGLQVKDQKIKQKQ